MGVADVAVAFAFVLTAVALASRTRRSVTDEDRVKAYGATRHVIAVVPVLLALFFLAGNRVDWEVLIVGLAWRGWLFVYTLPHLVAALRENPA